MSLNTRYAPNSNVQMHGINRYTPVGRVFLIHSRIISRRNSLHHRNKCNKQKSSNDSMKNNIINALVVRVTFVIFLAALETSLSLLLSSLQPYKPFYAFAQTQENAALSLSNLINHGASYEGSTSAPVTLIDFSDLQCHLCDRYVKATEPIINSTYVQTGKVAFVFLHLPNRGFDSFPAALAAQCTKDQGSLKNRY
jgi:hypothetical protein